ncbi:TonB-dependent receptor [bacterium]|nr:TonB-dependent receptor [bacterium]
MTQLKTLKYTAVYILAASLPAPAQDRVLEPDSDALLDAGAPVLKPMTVIGSKEDTVELQGSGYFVDSEEIRTQNYSNVNRILARVPGVYVREEDGSGNFPNISLRGADGTRSEKTTIMEDGILSAPATYSAPGAYYSPRAGRMSGIEVLKGSSQVKYGPHTTGGVINYLSTPIPEESQFYGRYTYGTDNTMLGHFHYGNTVDTEAGKFGYLFELFANTTDGFRDIQPGTGYGGSDNTGFEVYEPMFKLSWEPNTTLPQRFEFKYGYTDLDADETYTGLTESDVRGHPDWRYAATRFDNIQTEHHRTYLKYVVEPTDNLRFEAAGYYNEFSRNWYKLDGATGDTFSNVRSALLDPAGQAFLQGRGAGTGRVRANNRDYELFGFQIAGDYSFETGSVEHDLHFGARVHKDEIRRFQRDDRFVQDGTGQIVDFITGEEGSGGNRFQESTAIALWLQDEITLGALTVTPGLRFETIDQDYIDYSSNSTNTRTRSDSGTINYVAPGISFSLDLTETEQLFGGVFKGVSVPGPRSSIRSGVDLEESIGYELGFRTQKDNGFFGELVAFYTDFDNLIGTDSGFGDNNTETNAGAATVWGLEGSLRYDPLEGSAYDLSMPMYVSTTWTNAEFDSDLASGGGDGIYAGANNGAEIPYIPEFQFAVGVGLKTDTWGANLDLTYQTETFGTAQNFDDPVNTAREGKIDDLLLLDLSAYYQINENVKLVGGVSNLTDERGIVSRVPRGPRTNQGRAFWLGAEFDY